MHISLHINDFTFNAHAQKRQSERLQRRKNVSATSPSSSGKRIITVAEKTASNTLQLCIVVRRLPINLVQF